MSNKRKIFFAAAAQISRKRRQIIKINFAKWP